MSKRQSWGRRNAQRPRPRSRRAPSRRRPQRTRVFCSAAAAGWADTRTSRRSRASRPRRSARRRCGRRSPFGSPAALARSRLLQAAARKTSRRGVRGTLGPARRRAGSVAAFLAGFARRVHHASRGRRETRLAGASAPVRPRRLRALEGSVEQYAIAATRKHSRASTSTTSARKRVRLLTLTRAASPDYQSPRSPPACSRQRRRTRTSRTP